MSGDGSVTVTPSNKLVDTSELTVAGQTVERQRMVVSDSADPSGLSEVSNVPPLGGEYGLLVSTERMWFTDDGIQ